MMRCRSRSSGSPPPNAAYAPLDGSQGRPQAWSWTEKNRIRMRPSQNCGMANPVVDTTVKKLSTLPPRRSAPVTPSGIEIRTPSRIAVIVSSSVLGRRSRMWLMTGLPSISERPKSPCSIPPSHVTYWSQMGRSRPRLALMRAMSAGFRSGL